MSGTLLINGNPVAAKEFAFDGCHKVYLIFTDEDRQSMVDNGYGDDIFPVSKLPGIWEDTCPLRFISPASLDGPDLIGQGDDDGTVEYRP